MIGSDYEISKNSSQDILYCDTQMNFLYKKMMGQKREQTVTDLLALFCSFFLPEVFGLEEGSYNLYLTYIQKPSSSMQSTDRLNLEHSAEFQMKNEETQGCKSTQTIPASTMATAYQLSFQLLSSQFSPFVEELRLSNLKIQLLKRAASGIPNDGNGCGQKKEEKNQWRAFKPIIISKPSGLGHIY